MASANTAGAAHHRDLVAQPLEAERLAAREAGVDLAEPAQGTAGTITGQRE
jgi:hypothetical protein